MLPIHDFIAKHHYYVPVVVYIVVLPDYSVLSFSA